MKITKSLFMPNLKALLKKRVYGQRFYPTKEVEVHFASSLSRFETKDSLVAKLGSRCLGLFLKLGEAPIEPSHTPIGVYAGSISTGKGEYHLDLSDESGQLIIDGTPDPLHPLTCFGYMNEDIYDNKYNVKINKDGSIEVTNTIYPGDELLVRYDADFDDYDWDWIKQEALSALINEIKSNFDWIDDLEPDSTLHSIQLLTRRPLHKAIDDIIHARCWSENMHSATPSPGWTGTSGLALFLTSGVTYEKYRFGGFGSGKIFPETIIRRGKLAQFADRWDGANTAQIDESTIFKRERNTHIRSLRDLLADKYDSASPMVHRNSELLPTITRTVGRVTLTLFLGSARKKRNLFTKLAGAKSRGDLHNILVNDRIWRTSIETSTSENMAIPGRGYCGFISMDRIIHKTNRILDPVSPTGMELLIALIGTLIDAGTEPFRSNWKDIPHSVRTGRERLASTLDHLQSKRLDWISLNKLPHDYWLVGKTLINTCKDWNYSRWYTHPDHPDKLVMEENQYTLSSQASYKEWCRTLTNEMLCFDVDHYYNRCDGLLADFKTAFDECCNAILDTPYPIRLLSPRK